MHSMVAGLGVAAIGVTQASAAPVNGNGSKKCYGGGSQCTNGKQCCSGTCTNRVCIPEVDVCATMNCDDDNPCTIDSCSGGQCIHTPAAKGTSCGPGGASSCDGNGQCLPPTACTPFEQHACYSGQPGTEGVGVCKAGTEMCDPMGMGWGPCIGEVTPSKELCFSGLDEDCDGMVDNGCQNACIVPSDCMINETFCQQATCIQGQCGVSNTAGGTPLPDNQQIGSDCRTAICDGSGNTISIPDDTDLPPEKPCVNYVCKDGQVSCTLDPAGTECTTFEG
ncbi:MAG TPA: hypothetical protein VFP05_01345 [Thermomicrobiales bacterium]|nr:hypothetical protein [Thermomicrobiales bacterium]